MSEAERVLQQLPRGRHRLTREEVFRSQRLRMLAAMAEAVAEKGYARTAVADVIQRAGVSRETFYKQFTDKEDCFLAAYETIVEEMLGRVGDAMSDGRDGDPYARFSRGLAEYLRLMTAEPAFARTFLIEVYGAGPRAVARRLEVQARFVDQLVAAFGVRTKRGRFACEALVAAVSSMVTTRVAAGDLESIPRLHKPLMELVHVALEEHRSAA